jgi:DNA-binding NtrC family response regulator
VVAFAALILAVYAATVSTLLVVRNGKLANRALATSPAAPAHGDTALPAASASTDKPLIILIDDDPSVLMILHRLVAQMAPDYQVMPVPSGAQALAYMSLRPVPVVITEFKLEEGMDGLRLTDAIKEVSPQTYVIMSTVYATPELEQSAYAHRVNYFLPKPFPLTQLKKLLRDAGVQTSA